MRLLIHGSGFQRPFRNDTEEVRCGRPRALGGNPDCHWSPSSLDWEALGRLSGGSTGVATVSQLLDVVRAQPVESIEELRIVGHSNGKFLALAGTITADEVRFTENAMIGDSASFVSLRSAFRTLQNRFRADGRVVLAGCGSGGVDSNLLEMASHTFLRVVAGFTEPIMYAFDARISGPLVRDNGRVIGQRIDNVVQLTRGKAMYSSAANQIESVLGADAVGTSVLQTNAWNLVPDAESKAGDVFALGKRFKASPGVITAAEFGYKMLKVFSPFRGNVGGIGFAGNVAALRVTNQVLDIGKGWVDRLTPSTLEQRVRELDSAVELTVRRQSGLVPAR